MIIEFNQEKPFNYGTAPLPDGRILIIADPGCSLPEPPTLEMVEKRHGVLGLKFTDAQSVRGLIKKLNSIQWRVVKDGIQRTTKSAESGAESGAERKKSLERDIEPLGDPDKQSVSPHGENSAP